MQKRETAPYRVLFLGNGNRSTSILAEAYLNWAGRNRFRAYSAGYGSAGVVDPLAKEVLERHRIDPSKCCSKSWDQFVGQHAPAMDFIFVVCAEPVDVTAARWPGQPVISQWPLSLPAQGDVFVRRNAFLHAFAEVTERVNKFLDVPIDMLPRPVLQATLDDIGAGRP